MKEIIITIIILMFCQNISNVMSQSKKEKILSNNLKFSNLSGGESLCPGTVFEIQWEGVNASDPVKIEYSTNGGTNWITITEAATGLKYNWTIPNTASTNCVARVTVEVADALEEVTICSQTWMLKNLDVDHYRNGDPIPEITDNTAWMNATEGAWCYYENNPANGDIYGKLYNWFAVNDARGLAPEGWHIPSDDEWKTLEMCLGMTQSEADATNWRGTDEGGKLREAGTTHWNSPNNGATNESGFTALPSSSRAFSDGQFMTFGWHCFWWSSTVYNANYSWSRLLNVGTTTILRDGYNNRNGFSVRCVKD